MQAVTSSKLREDLFYRLNVFPIHLPPLRERAEDVPLIAEHFLEQISKREGTFKRFSPDALTRLSMHRWAGNVRELRNIVYRAFVMAPDTTIVDECLPTAESPLPVMTGAPVISVRVGTPLAEIEKQVTLATLEHLGRHKEKTAATLGISLKTLYNRLKEYAVVNDNGDINTAAVALDDKE
jgi:two-component system, NtrC family, response regulator AtoC